MATAVIDFSTLEDGPASARTASGIKPKPTTHQVRQLANDLSPLPERGKKYTLRLQVQNPDMLDAKTMLDFFTEFCNEQLGGMIKVSIDARRGPAGAGGRAKATGPSRSTHEDKMVVIRELMKRAERPMGQKELSELLEMNQANLSRTLTRAVNEGELVKFKDRQFKWVWMVMPSEEEGGLTALKQWMAPTEIDTSALAAALQDSDGLAKLKTQLNEALGTAARDGRGVRRSDAADTKQLQEMARAQARVKQLEEELAAIKEHPMGNLMKEFEEFDDDLEVLDFK